MNKRRQMTNCPSRHHVAALCLIALGLHPAAPAFGEKPMIPWSKLRGVEDLLQNERDTAAAAMMGLTGYLGCRKKIAECLQRKSPSKSTLRLANYLVFLAGKGLNRKEIEALFAKRRQSARPTKVHKLQTAAAPSYGPKGKAKLTIVEYADFRCGHCAALSPVLKKLLNGYPKQVRLFFKPFPLRPGASVLAAQAALAAHRQGKFWRMHDLLFKNPDKHTEAGVLALARQAELDVSRFRRDLKSKFVSSTVDANKVEGLRIGVRATPSLFFNGKPYLMRRDRRHLAERIEEELELAH